MKLEMISVFVKKTHEGTRHYLTIQAVRSLVAFVK